MSELQITEQDLVQFMNRDCKITMRCTKDTQLENLVQTQGVNYTLYDIVGKPRECRTDYGCRLSLVVEAPRGTLTEFIALNVDMIEEITDEFKSAPIPNMPDFLSGALGLSPDASIVHKNPKV